MSRRAVLAVSGCLALVLVFPLGHRARADPGTVERLEQLLRSRGWDHEDPWVLLHVEPWRPRAASGAPSERLAASLASHVQWTAVGVLRAPAFLRSVEAHPFQVVFLLRRAGIAEDARFETSRGDFSLAALAQASRAGFDPETDPLELPWAVSTLVAEQPGGEGRFVTGDGRSVAILDLVDALLRATEEVYAASNPARAACNGTHVVSGLIAAARHGYATGDRRERIRRLVEHALQRTEEEPARLRQRYSRPGTYFYATASQLTFLGHTLELAREAEAAGLIQAEVHRERLAGARRELVTVVEALATRTDLDAMAALHAKAVAVTLGDAAHALSGLQEHPE